MTLSATFFLIFGCAILFLSGEALVRAAVACAERLRIPQILIGVTVVSMATSAPELIVSADAALSDRSGIAIGNVVGSNIVNVLLALALPALIVPAACDRKELAPPMIWAIVAAAVFVALCVAAAQGEQPVLRAADGIILLALFALFLADAVRTALRARRQENDQNQETPISTPVLAGLLLGSSLGLAIGADLVVDAGSEIAKGIGVSEATVGVVAVAFGTSLPELAAGLVAALKNRHAVAVGNILGSNVFNIFAVMGVAAVLAPIELPDPILLRDLPVMAIATIVLAPCVFLGVAVSRPFAAALLVAYAAWLVVVVDQASMVG